MTRLTTPDQSPGALCRNSRAVGYQGLSSRSMSHRQSGTNGNKTQTGFASAPARWQRWYRPRSKDPGLRRWRSIRETLELIPEMQKIASIAQDCGVAWTHILLQAHEPGVEIEELQKGSKLDRPLGIVLVRRAAGPGYPDSRTVVPFELAVPAFRAFRRSAQIGHVSRKRLHCGPEHQRQAEQRAMQIKMRKPVPRGN